MHKCCDKEALNKRINRVIGQLNGINKMIAQDSPCDEVLIQINAVKNAAHKIGQIILEGHLKHCVRDGITHGDADKTISEFAKAVEQFCKLS